LLSLIPQNAPNAFGSRHTSDTAGELTALLRARSWTLARGKLQRTTGKLEEKEKEGETEARKVQRIPNYLCLPDWRRRQGILD